MKSVSGYRSISADITGQQQGDQWPEGAVASKTIRSVNIINQGLARLQTRGGGCTRYIPGWGCAARPLIP